MQLELREQITSQLAQLEERDVQLAKQSTLVKHMEEKYRKDREYWERQLTNQAGLIARMEEKYDTLSEKSFSLANKVKELEQKKPQPKSKALEKKGALKEKARGSLEAQEALDIQDALPSVITSADQQQHVWTVNDRRRQELLDGGKLPDEEGESKPLKAHEVTVTALGSVVKLDEDELINRAARAVPEGSALGEIMKLATAVRDGVKERTSEGTLAEQERLVDSLFMEWSRHERLGQGDID